jgi:hypothetical protein
VKVRASHTPSRTPHPLTSRSSRTHRWDGAQPQSDRCVSCAYRAAGWGQPLPVRSLHVRPRCPQARVPQLQPLDEQERSKCAIGLPWALVRKHTPGSGTGAHAWSKLVNVEMWGHVTDAT